MKIKTLFSLFIGLLFFLSAYAQYPPVENDLDKKIKSFLEENENNWKDMNVPVTDGKILYDIIIKNNYKSAVEIGTSTGHSAIWIAWALSKTGGKLITIEIDRDRFIQAKANFRKAGVADFIDMRLGDAHEIVPSLMGKYDFVFSDADKFWYKRYFQALDPKLVPGGCFTIRNAAVRSPGIGEFLDYVEGLDNYTTTIDKSSSSGMSVSYKKME